MSHENIVIDLSRDDRVGFDKNEQLFHRNVYRELANQVVGAIASSTRCLNSRDDKDNINEVRRHNAVLLDGGRGTGKTSLLVNLPGYISHEDNFKDRWSEVLFLDPIDPTLLHDNENFLYVAIAQINDSKEIKNSLNNPKNHHPANEYFGALEALAAAIEDGPSRTQDRSGLDALMDYQGSLGVAECSHRYFRTVLNMLGKKLIVIPIDDVDMALNHGFEVLEAVRKYLCSPYALPIVSGDLKLYNELVLKRFIEKLDHQRLSEEERNSVLRQARDLTTEYLRKVFPAQNRLYIPTVGQYFKGRDYYGNTIKVEIKEGEKLIIDLANLDRLLHAAMSGRVNGEEQSSAPLGLESMTARRLSQMLKALHANLVKIVDKDVADFKNEVDAQKWWLKKDRRTARRVYASLAEHFHHTRQLHLFELCSFMAKANNEEAYISRLADVAYLNPLIQLEHEGSSPRHNESYALYVDDQAIFQTQKGRLPEALLRKEIPLLVSLPAIEPIDSKLKFPIAWRSNKKTGVYDDGDFLLELFTHDDYYSSYQTAPIVFFGRFFELMTISLIQDITTEWLNKLLARPPYYSLLETNSTKTFDIDEDLLDENLQENSSNTISDDRDTGRENYLKKLAAELNAFRSEIRDKAFIDLSLVHSVQSKYFNQINLYKLGTRNVGNNRHQRTPRNGHNLLKEVSLRSAYVYWSSFGSFEMGSLFCNPPKKVPHQNFASLEKIIEENIPTSNPLYNNCIRPFRGQKEKIDAYTSRLEEHPVMQKVLNWTKGISLQTQEDMLAVQQIQLPPEIPHIWKKFGKQRVTVEQKKRPQYFTKVSDALEELGGDLSAMNSADDKLRINATLTALESLLRALDTVFNGRFNDISIRFMARIGLAIKQGYFYKTPTGATPLRYLLERVWLDLLDSNDDYMTNREICASQLLRKNVNPEVAALLTSAL